MEDGLVQMRELQRQLQRLRKQQEELEERNEALAVRMVRVAQLPRYAKVEWELEFSLDDL